MRHAGIDGRTLRRIDACRAAGSSGLSCAALLGMMLDPLFAFMCAGRVGWCVGSDMLNRHCERLLIPKGFNSPAESQSRNV